MIGSPMRSVLSRNWGWVLVVLVLGPKETLGGYIPPDPTLTVKENGKNIGTISIKVNGNQISGNFTGTAPLGDLAKSLNEDHFNWLQDISFATPINITTYTYNADGTKVTKLTTTKVTTTLIDPQSGGQSLNGGKSGLWADKLPWYWDETIPPINLVNITKPPDDTPAKLMGFYDPNQTELQAKTTGSKLLYGDIPSGQALAGNTLIFTTFLVSIGPDNTYCPLAGFTWTDKFDVAGNGTITLSTLSAGTLKPATFTSEINTEINSQNFGNWKECPEPSTLVLLAVGLIGAMLLRLAQSFQHKSSTAAAKSVCPEMLLLSG
jgi:hypothetical protein